MLGGARIKIEARMAPHGYMMIYAAELYFYKAVIFHPMRQIFMGLPQLTPVQDDDNSKHCYKSQCEAILGDQHG